ncbi:MAG TPA: hypothetical protein PK992_04500 [Planctomycetaceae bacterium]|nr:hypothetical protein [Planctomycetaceae bacterium]
MMPCIFVTMISGIKVCVLGALGVTFSSTILLAADQEPVAKSFRDRVCDQAILADGARLTGVAINESPTRIALRTVRLKADAPDLFKQEIEPALAKQQTDQNQQLINILQKRIDQLKQDAPNDRQQIGLLEETVERLSPEHPETPPWLIVEIEAKRLKRLELQTPNRRELATLAALNKINDLEDLHWNAVAARLQTIPPAQLKRPVAAQQAAPPEVVAERILAAVDVRLNKATRLIRTGNDFLPEDAKPDLSVLMSSLLGNSLNSTLQDLLNETGGAVGNPAAAKGQNSVARLPESAVRIAEKNGHSTAVISSFDFDVARGAASVTKQLFRKSKTGEWTLMTSSTSSASTADITPEQVKRIEEDPQVKEISGLLSALSSDTSALNTALQMGAVVQTALSESDAAFQRSLQDTLTATADDNPPIVILKATAE